MYFNQAIEALKEGKKITRLGWNSKGMFLELQNPYANSKSSLPDIFLITISGNRIPWNASSIDILSNDWKIIPSKPN